jgi:hypothetical protein
MSGIYKIEDLIKNLDDLLDLIKRVNNNQPLLLNQINNYVKVYDLNELTELEDLQKMNEIVSLLLLKSDAEYNIRGIKNCSLLKNMIKEQASLIEPFFSFFATLAEGEEDEEYIDYIKKKIKTQNDLNVLIETIKIICSFFNKASSFYNKYIELPSGFRINRGGVFTSTDVIEYDSFRKIFEEIFLHGYFIKFFPILDSFYFLPIEMNAEIINENKHDFFLNFDLTDLVNTVLDLKFFDLPIIPEEIRLEINEFKQELENKKSVYIYMLETQKKYKKMYLKKALSSLPLTTNTIEHELGDYLGLIREKNLNILAEDDEFLDFHKSIDLKEKDVVDDGVVDYGVVGFLDFHKFGKNKNEPKTKVKNTKCDSTKRSKSKKDATKRSAKCSKSKKDATKRSTKCSAKRSAKRSKSKKDAAKRSAKRSKSKKDATKRR